MFSLLQLHLKLELQLSASESSSETESDEEDDEEDRDGPEGYTDEFEDPDRRGWSLSAVG